LRLAEMLRVVGEVLAVGGKRVLARAALGRQHVEETFDQRIVGSGGLAFFRRAHAHFLDGNVLGRNVLGRKCPWRAQRLRNLSCGTVTVMSRGVGAPKVASANMAP